MSTHTDLLIPTTRLETPEAIATADAWRYVKGATKVVRGRIDHILREADERSDLKEIFPAIRGGKKIVMPHIPFPLHLLVECFRKDLSPERRIALSQLIDREMEERLQGHIVVTRCDLSKVDRTFLTPEGGAKEIMYEHMPTMEATGTTLGGLSEAQILIEKNAPESLKLHAHPGWRIVTSMTSGGNLALPDRVVPLSRGSVVFMPKLAKHSFQDGTYFTIHGNEPGFDNEEAILWLDEDPPTQ